MRKNNATRDARVLIYTKHDSSHMPIEVTDEASLERAFQDISRMSEEVCRPRPPSNVFAPLIDTPKRLLHIPVLSYTGKYPLEE